MMLIPKNSLRSSQLRKPAWFSISAISPVVYEAATEARKPGRITFGLMIV